MSLDLTVHTVSNLKFFIKMILIYLLVDWEPVAGFVIQATGTVEFEDGLRTGVPLGSC